MYYSVILLVLVCIAFMIGIHYSFCVLSYRMPVKLTGDALIGINDIYTSVSVILVSLHYTVDIAMTGMSVSVIPVGLHCTVGIVMTGMFYLLYVFSSRMPVELTGDALIGVDHTT